MQFQENGAAYEAGGLEVGQLILEVDGQKVEGRSPEFSHPLPTTHAPAKLTYSRVSGMHHQEIARLIAESFARREKHEIEFLVVEAKKSNLEPKPTALIFLEA